MDDTARGPLPRLWNASPADAAAHAPCDDLGFAADDVYVRAVDVAAPPELVFRWLCQLRVAPYSYDLLDNFARRSPPRLTPGLEELRVGQRMMTIFRVASFDAPRQLTTTLASRLGAAVMGDFAGSYLVEPRPWGARLVAKILVRYPRGPLGAVHRMTMPWLDLVMFRKQLLTLRRYMERDARMTVSCQSGSKTAATSASTSVVA